MRLLALPICLLPACTRQVVLPFPQGVYFEGKQKAETALSVGVHRGEQLEITLQEACPGRSSQLGDPESWRDALQRGGFFVEVGRVAFDTSRGAHIGLRFRRADIFGDLLVAPAPGASDSAPCHRLEFRLQRSRVDAKPARWRTPFRLAELVEDSNKGAPEWAEPPFFAPSSDFPPYP
jgi:hypothetical protein